MFIVINDVQRLIGLDTLQEFMAAGKGDGGGSYERTVGNETGNEKEKKQ